MKILKYNHEPGNIPPSMKNLSLFSFMRSSCLEEVLQHAAIVEMEAGDHLVAEGHKSNGLYLLLKGKLSISIKDRQVLILDKPGDLVGELAYVLNEPHHATVTAIGKAAAFRIDADVTDALSDTNYEHFQYVLHRYLTKLLAERLKKAAKLLAETPSKQDVFYL